LEAWNWLEREGILIRDPKKLVPWFTISRSGEELLKEFARFERFEKLGFDRVKSDMENTGGIRDIGGPLETREAAWKWLEMKKNQAKTNADSSRVLATAPPKADDLPPVAQIASNGNLKLQEIRPFCCRFLQNRLLHSLLFASRLNGPAILHRRLD
jgi:hypothetical protein